MILIIIFLGIYFIQKNEHFAENCDINQWSTTELLHGCSFIENGEYTIKLLWNKDLESKNKSIIINPLNNNTDTLIIYNDKINVNVKTLKKEIDGKNNMWSYTIPNEYIEVGKTYLITLNYLDESEESKKMYASNTIQISVNRQTIIDGNKDNSCRNSTQLFDSLKNKIFDIYLE